MKNGEMQNSAYIHILGVEQTPYIRKDGFQEAVLSFRNTKSKFNAWYKVYMDGIQPYANPLGTAKRGKNKINILLPDTNGLLNPGQTTSLKIEIYDNELCQGLPVGAYENGHLERTRHWEFFYSQTMHTDLGYTDYQEDLRPLFSAFLDTVKQYMKNSDERETDIQKYKYAIESGWVMGEGYLPSRNADEIQEIVDLIEKDRIIIGAGCCNHTMECFSTEETARAAYYTNRYLVDKLGISPSTVQRMFDNPAFSKSYVDVAVCAGIKYGIHSMNPDRSPYHKKKEYDLFYMQGNSPENKLLVFNGKTYGENYGFGGNYGKPTIGNAEMAEKDLLKLVRELESRTGRRSYPYDKFPLPLIPFGDNKPPLEKQIEIVNKVNRKWSAAGYAYPRIVADFPEKFFEAVEKEYGSLIPVETGTEENWWNDGWGTTAFESGINKEAGALVPMAETAAGFSSLLWGTAYPHEDIDCAVKRNLIYDEHTWGYHSYTGDEMYHKQFEWKRSNAFGAKCLAEKVLSDSVNTLASKVKVNSQSIYVYNALNWVRDDVAVVEDISSLPAFFEITDGETSVPYAVDNGKLIFVAKGVPAIGYKVFTVKSVSEKPFFETQCRKGNFIENAFYAVSFDTDGTIKSIVDKINGGREVADCSAVKFNQYQYYDDFGIPFSNMGAKFSKYKWKEYSPKSENTVITVRKTPVFTQAVVDTGTFRAGSIRQKVTLYNGIPRIDIVNEVVKSHLPSLKSKEEAFYAFPFQAGKDYEIRYDLPVGNAAEGEQVYGTSTDWYTANKWVNVYDKSDNYSMTLAIPNSALLQFGERRTGNWSFDYKSEKPYIFSYIFNNMWQTNFQGDQPGYASFRYSVHTQKGKSATEINQFSLNCCSPLQTAVIKNAQNGTDALQRAYIEINKENVMLTTLKMAESNGNGMIVRFSEIGGEKTENVQVQFPQNVISYTETDIIENSIGEEQSGNVINFDIPPYGFKTFRILTTDTLTKVTGVKAVSSESADRKENICGTRITWNKVDGALYYEVFRIRENGRPIFLFATDKNAYFDAQVEAKISDKYKYAVRACASGTKGEFSDSVSPTKGEITDINPPEKPILYAVAREKQRIDLFWTPAYDTTLLSHYEIYRNGEKIAAVIDPYVCTYRDNAVRFGNTYTYSVVAVDKCNNQSVSETVVFHHTSDIIADSDSEIAKKKEKSLYLFFLLKKTR